MSITANTGRERNTDTTGAKKRANNGDRYAIIPEINAKRKEIINANNARNKLIPSPNQKLGLDNSSPIFKTLSDTEGTNSSFPVAKYKYDHTMAKNIIATRVCHTV